MNELHDHVHIVGLLNEKVVATVSLIGFNTDYNASRRVKKIQMKLLS